MGRKQGFGGIKKDVCACVCGERRNGAREWEEGEKKRNQTKPLAALLHSSRERVSGGTHAYVHPCSCSMHPMQTHHW